MTTDFYSSPGTGGGGGSGTVVEVVAGTGLTGGTITTSGTIAVKNPLSPNIVYASQAGVPSINPASPLSGSAGTTQLQAILNMALTAPLELVIDIPVRAKGLLIYSNTTIRGLGTYSGSQPIAGLWQDVNTSGTETFSILQNAHLISPLAGSIVDSNITIKDLYMNAGRGYGASGGSDPRFNPQGDGVSPICMFGVNNLRLENLYVYDQCWFAYYCANINQGVFKNLTMVDPVVAASPQPFGRNTDGLHFVGPVNDIEIDGLYGTTGDDFLALDFADQNVANPSSMLAPRITQGNCIQNQWDVLYYGTGKNVIARNIFPTGCASIVAIRGGQPFDDSAPPIGASDILIDGVAGSFYGYAFFYQDYSPNGAGTVNLTLSNWNLTPLANTTGTDYSIFNIDSTLDSVPVVHSNLKIQNISIQNLQSSTSQSGVILAGGATGNQFDRFEISGLSIQENSSEVSSPAIPVNIADTTGTEITLANCSWQRNSFTNLPFCILSGSTINRINMRGISGNNISNLLSIASSSVITDINTAGISHIGAGGNPSITIATGLTVARLRSCGSDTALLHGGSGTITNIKTDNTQDA